MITMLEGFRTIPVCTLRSPAEARPLGEALVAGGLPVVEVTLRTPDALAGLAEMCKVPGLTVGAGTVRTAQQMHEVLEAGAAFAVSPALTASLADAAHALGLPFIPGVATPTEIQTAVDAGFDTVKFFPAEASGGVRALKALTDVFVDVRFMPTGGITQDSARDYRALDQVFAVGGSWMLPLAAREAEDWEAVRLAVAACVASAEAER
ncbi:ketohydroxyglutarate aldolase [Nocardioides baekrokdamisoli]|uniref:2-dehydro-3-deoxy-phosphogluconate aldolase n=2 Tax=Nocardioides baekrokdamisoli TaxID=1804624 RepID=A0A3G9J1X2_9ACTN|nr:ketohydroxyglutarate aldolase [Nocardioides baekrokdamisoli]